MPTRHSGLTVAQIAAHLGTRPWNVTRELQLTEKGITGRLQGYRVFDDGAGRGGQWRVSRIEYLDRLGIPTADRIGLGPDELPALHPIEDVAIIVGTGLSALKKKIRQQRRPHITFGRRQYLTDSQLQQLIVEHQPPAGPAGEVPPTIYRE
jgi:hypothetical protein